MINQNITQLKFFRPTHQPIMVKYSRLLQEDQAGAIIGKNRNKIREIREMAGVSLVIQKQQGAQMDCRLMKIEGKARNVEFAKHLVDIRLKL